MKISCMGAIGVTMKENFKETLNGTKSPSMKM